MGDARAPYCGTCERPLFDTDEMHDPRGEVAEAERERDAAFDRGRTVGRRDVDKYSRALGEIEAALGIVGAQPMADTVEAVRRLRRVGVFSDADEKCNLTFL